MEELLLSRAEAAKVLGISITTLDQLRFEGKLTYIQYKRNGKVWIPETEINKLIKKATKRCIVEQLRPTVRKVRAR